MNISGIVNLLRPPSTLLVGSPIVIEPPQDGTALIRIPAWKLQLRDGMIPCLGAVFRGRMGLLFPNKGSLGLPP